jgi:hypothetical protein
MSRDNFERAGAGVSYPMFKEPKPSFRARAKRRVPE